MDSKKRVSNIEEARVSRLAAELLPELRERGVVARPIVEIEGVNRWRRTARRAGREVGWRIRTRVNEEIVFAVSDDYPVKPEDRYHATRVAADLIVRRFPPSADEPEGSAPPNPSVLTC